MGQVEFLKLTYIVLFPGHPTSIPFLNTLKKDKSQLVRRLNDANVLKRCYNVVEFV